MIDLHSHILPGLDDGARDLDEAVEIATAAGLDVVSNRCVKIEHARFHGGLHIAGFNTGVISSRRRAD